MKTKWLSTTYLPKDFKEHLKVYESISKDHLEEIVPWITKVLDPLTEEYESREFRSLADKLQISEDTLINILATVSYAKDVIDKWGDSSEDIISDLVSEEYLSKDNANKFEFLLKSIIDLPTTYFQLSHSLETIIPRFNGIDTSVILISKFDKEFNQYDDPNEYKPTIKDFLPGITLKIDTDGPDGEKVFNFVLTERDLLTFIKMLELAKIQLNVVSNYSEKFIKEN